MLEESEWTEAEGERKRESAMPLPVSRLFARLLRDSRFHL